MLQLNDYTSDYLKSLQDPEGFWLKRAQDLAWFEPPQTALSRQANGLYRWYAGGKLNTSYLALDHHVEQGRGEQAALIYESPVTGKSQTYSYRALRDQVAKFAGVLKGLGAAKRGYGSHLHAHDT